MNICTVLIKTTITVQIYPGDYVKKNRILIYCLEQYADESESGELKN